MSDDFTQEQLHHSNRCLGVEKPAWLDIAREEDGVEEPESVKYFTATNYDDPQGSTPYCAAFVGWCLIKAGKKGTRSAAAKSYVTYGKDVSETKPAGAIVVFRWQSGGYHVTFYAGGKRSIAGHGSFLGTAGLPYGKKGYKGYLGGNQTPEHRVCEEDLPLSRAIAWRWPEEA
jgi:uncharacterized protein (TIGR02594 family)